MEPLATDEEYILSVAENAVGKRTPVADYRRQTRGGKGIINLKVSPKTGPVIGAKHVGEQDGLMLITQDGKIIRINVEGVRKSGRSTMGVKLMDLGADDRLVAVAKLAEREEMDEGEQQSPRVSRSISQALSLTWGEVRADV
jgi:DNA gyrase subunit A